MKSPSALCADDPSIEAALPSAESIERHLFLHHDHWVILDADLARLYGVSRRRLLAMTARHHDRFPGDFCFPLDRVEMANAGRPDERDRAAAGDRRHQPYVFTEYGGLLLGDMLEKPGTMAMGIALVRAVLRLRRQGLR